MEESQGRTFRPKLIAIAVLIVLALIVLFQNVGVVTVRLFFWSLDMSQAILVVVMLAVGFLLGMLTALVRRKRHS